MVAAQTKEHEEDKYTGMQEKNETKRKIEERKSRKLGITYIFLNCTTTFSVAMLVL